MRRTWRVTLQRGIARLCKLFSACESNEGEEAATYTTWRLPMHTTPTVEARYKRGNQRPFITYCFERTTLWFALRMALVVGTILGIINHGQAIITGHFTSDRLISLLVTYCVPF